MTDGYARWRANRAELFKTIQQEQGCAEVICANYFSENCACMDSYETALAQDTFNDLILSHQPPQG